MTDGEYKPENLSKQDGLKNNKIGIENSFKWLGVPPIITAEMIVVYEEEFFVSVYLSFFHLKRNKVLNKAETEKEVLESPKMEHKESPKHGYQLPSPKPLASPKTPKSVQDTKTVQLASPKTPKSINVREQETVPESPKIKETKEVFEIKDTPKIQEIKKSQVETKKILEIKNCEIFGDGIRSCLIAGSSYQIFIITKSTKNEVFHDESLKIQCFVGDKLIDTIHNDKNGIYDFHYTPTFGSNEIKVKFNDQIFFTKTVKAIYRIDHTKSFAEGNGLTFGSFKKNDTKKFKITVKDEKENVVSSFVPMDVVILSPDENITEHEILQSNDGIYEVSYTPTIEGKYLVGIKVDGKSIRGSPYTFNLSLIKPQTEAKIVSFGGDGIKQFGNISNQKTDFKITCDEKMETLEINIIQPNSVYLGFTITPSEENENSKIISYTPKLFGLHMIEVKIDSKHVKGSPFHVNIEKPKWFAYGSGIESKVRKGTKQRITIQPKSSLDYSYIDCLIIGPKNTKSQEFKLQVDEKNDQFLLEYYPNEEGTYKIDIAIDDSAITGSPFFVQSTDELLNPETFELKNLPEMIILNERIECFIESSSDLKNAKIECQIIEKGDLIRNIPSIVTKNGSVQLNFQTKHVGKFELKCTVNDQNIKGSPYHLECIEFPYKMTEDRISHNDEIYRFKLVKSPLIKKSFNKVQIQIFDEETVEHFKQNHSENDIEIELPLKKEAKYKLLINLDDTWSKEFKFDISMDCDPNQSTVEGEAVETVSYDGRKSKLKVISKNKNGKRRFRYKDDVSISIGGTNYKNLIDCGDGSYDFEHEFKYGNYEADVSINDVKLTKNPFELVILRKENEVKVASPLNLKKKITFDKDHILSLEKDYNDKTTSLLKWTDENLKFISNSNLVDSSNQKLDKLKSEIGAKEKDLEELKEKLSKIQTKRTLENLDLFKPTISLEQIEQKWNEINSIISNISTGEDMIKRKYCLEIFKIEMDGLKVWLKIDEEIDENLTFRDLISYKKKRSIEIASKKNSLNLLNQIISENPQFFNYETKIQLKEISKKVLLEESEMQNFKNYIAFKQIFEGLKSFLIDISISSSFQDENNLKRLEAEYRNQTKVLNEMMRLYESLLVANYIFEEDIEEMENFKLEFEQVGEFLSQERLALENEDKLNIYLQKFDEIQHTIQTNKYLFLQGKITEEEMINHISEQESRIEKLKYEKNEYNKQPKHLSTISFKKEDILRLNEMKKKFSSTNDIAGGLSN